MNNQENEEFKISDVCLFYVISGSKLVKRGNRVKDDKLSIDEHENNTHTNEAKGFTFDRLVRVNKDTFKKYTVIVNYVEVTDEVRKMKRAIIEDILKKS